MPPADSKSSRRPLKRKADSGAEPSERKRAQNRISQQCLREKNAAYVRNLENAVELLQNTITDNDGGGCRDRYETLVEAHLKLLKENQRLEEALFRLRKKLLSLSNAAATAYPRILELHCFLLHFPYRLHLLVSSVSPSVGVTSQVEHRHSSMSTSSTYPLLYLLHCAQCP